METTNPFAGLVGGRLATWFEEAFVEYRSGRIRGTYDYAMLALNSTFYELKPAGKTLFERLTALEAEGKTGPEVLAWARGRDFLVRHDRGITDMDLSYMSVDELGELLFMLELLYRGLRERGVPLSHDPRGV